MNEPLKPEVAIFNGALEIAQTERIAYLDRLCAGDMLLRQKVEALLEANERAEDFLEIPPTGLAVTRTVWIPITEKAGDKIGRYKLLQQIGEGGCGVVYMAEQEEPVRRRVALKVIKLGMDTKEVIARFEAERQALAMMDHPNIAKALDAGATDTGRPYFVMELVRGIKITEFCDENKVSTEERLKLFVQVCQAIQHAHQKGIIHRDIKPSNILVTINDGVPVPKVIDFGIAKATQGRLTDSTLFTAFEQFIGTPAYMSPEQAMMTSLDIDTRSDIYSLGVLLYELLTGETPFDATELLQSGFDAMRQMIREKEPQCPSARLSTMVAAALTTTAAQRQTHPPKLLHMVSGDLDWIVMTCLEKDRSRRYETANGLAADIQRHLNTEPIVAHPPSGLYRLQKAIWRNKTIFAAAGAIATALVIGVFVSSLEAIRATRAEREQTRLRHLAETKEKKSEQVAQFLKDMLKSVGPKVALGRDSKMLHEILDATAERVGKDLKDQPEIEAELLSTIGTTYLQLFDLTKAEAMHREALRLRRSLFTETNEFIAASLNDLARVLINRPHDPGGPTLVEAEAMAREGLRIRRKLFGSDNTDVALSLYVLGSTLFWQNHLDEAEAMMREGLAIRKKLLGDHPDVASSLNNLSKVLDAEGKNREAEVALREALPIARRSVGPIHPDIADLLDSLGWLLRGQNRLGEAEPIASEALAMRRKLFGNEHPKVVSSLFLVARILNEAGQLAEARSVAEEAAAIRSRLADVDRSISLNVYTTLRAILNNLNDTQAIEALDSQFLQLFRAGRPDSERELAAALDTRADWLIKRGKLGEAEEIISGEELPIVQKLIEKNNKISENFILLGHLYWQLGRIRRESNRLAESGPMYTNALQTFTQASGDFPKEPFLRQEEAFTHRLLGDLSAQLGKIDEADGHYRIAIATYGALAKVHPEALFYYREEAHSTWVLGATLDHAGRLVGAETEYRRAIALLETAISLFPAEPDLKARLASIEGTLSQLLARRAKQ